MDKDSIINYVTRKINIAYRVNQNCRISFIVSDDKEVKKQIQEQITSIDTSTILDKSILQVWNIMKNIVYFNMKYILILNCLDCL